MTIERKPLTVKELHAQAMDAADKAIQAKSSNDMVSFRQFSLISYELERKAADYLIPTDREPTRSILLRSAATLALDCGLIRESEKLIAIALAGDPPNEIADELRDLLERVNFNRHLDLRGVHLQPGEVQISMTGDEVSFGMILSDLAVERVQDTEALILRTAERKADLPYRSRGGPSSEVKDMFSVYMSVPRAASFALTLRLGTQLDYFGQQNQIIHEVIQCVNLVNESKYEDLRSKIPEEAYFNNFVALTQKIAPDGKKIKMVGLTASGQSEEYRALLDTPKREIVKRSSFSIQRQEVSKDSYVEITGVLGYANRFRRDKIIRIKPSNSAQRTVYVPEGLMDDVVRPFWDREVIIRGFEDSVTKVITLESIDKI